MKSRNFCKMVSTTLAVLAATLIVGCGVAAAGTYETLLFFGGMYGNSPSSRLISDASGNLYGTTPSGGAFKAAGGTVFKLTRNPDGSWTGSVLHDFYCQYEGTCYPNGPLVFDTAGNLFGTMLTIGWGSGLFGGAVFKLMPNSDGTWTESVVHYFSDPAPVGGVIFDAAGNLYGTRKRPDDYLKYCLSESYNCGTIFKLTPNPDGSWTEDQLYSFTGGMDGASPNGGLIFDAAGALYGTTSAGGAYGYGTVFKLTPNSDGTWTESVLHQFTGGKDGSQPKAGLVFDATGHLYGTTTGGGAYGFGVVFKLTPSSDGTWTENVLHWFTNGRDGSAPFADLILDAAGNLYGTASTGGTYGYGVVFELRPTPQGGWAERVLWSFRNQPASNPRGGLLLDGAGNLYGTSAGRYSSTPGAVIGTLFKITP